VGPVYSNDWTGCSNSPAPMIPYLSNFVFPCVSLHFVVCHSYIKDLRNPLPIRKPNQDDLMIQLEGYDDRGTQFRSTSHMS
jgi:hypothetical protein